MKRTGTPLFRLTALAAVTLLAAGTLAGAQVSDRPVSHVAPDYMADRIVSDRVAPVPPTDTHPCERVAAAVEQAARVSAWLHQSVATHERILGMLAEREARVLEALAGNLTENQTIYLEHVLERISNAQAYLGERLERLRAALVQVEERIAYLHSLVERCREYWSDHAPAPGADEPDEIPVVDVPSDVKPAPTSDVRPDSAASA